MLEGKTFWLTRPEGQFESLQASLQDRGAIGVSLPMLAIEPLEPDATIKDRVLNLDHFDLLFFVWVLRILTSHSDHGSVNVNSVTDVLLCLLWLVSLLLTLSEFQEMLIPLRLSLK